MRGVIFTECIEKACLMMSHLKGRRELCGYVETSFLTVGSRSARALQRNTLSGESKAQGGE